ncbi:hypothetical protein [Defluviimonas sp. SAOS-178_SWC]
MQLVERRPGLLIEVIRAICSMDRVFAWIVPAEPAPYWTDYLRETRSHQS